MTCWCIGPVISRTRSVRLAFLLSIAFHAALVGWALRSAGSNAELPQRPPLADRQLSVKLLPSAKASAAPAYSTSLLTSLKSPPKDRRRPLPATPQTNKESRASALVATPAPEVTNQSTSAPQPDSAQPPQPLKLEMGRAALSADRDRRQSFVANEVGAKAQQAAESNQPRAFSALNATPSSSTVEARTADGGRLVRFSGGGCMKLPNPAARHYDDVRKPAVGNC